MEATMMAIMIEINNQDTVKRSHFLETFSLRRNGEIFIKDMKQHMDKCYSSTKEKNFHYNL